MNRRVKQVAKLLQVEIGRCIADLKLNLMVTVSSVDLSCDLKNAKIFLSFLDQNQEKPLEEIKKQKKEIINCLKKKKLKLKYFPRISFYQDIGGEYSQKIDKLLDQIK